MPPEAVDQDEHAVVRVGEGVEDVVHHAVDQRVEVRPVDALGGGLAVDADAVLEAPGGHVERRLAGLGRSGRRGRRRWCVTARRPATQVDEVVERAPVGGTPRTFSTTTVAPVPRRPTSWPSNRVVVGKHLRDPVSLGAEPLGRDGEVAVPGVVLDHVDDAAGSGDARAGCVPDGCAAR